MHRKVAQRLFVNRSGRLSWWRCSLVQEDDEFVVVLVYRHDPHQRQYRFDVDLVQADVWALYFVGDVTATPLTTVELHPDGLSVEDAHALVLAARKQHHPPHVPSSHVAA